jgi:hypothetical protein
VTENKRGDLEVLTRTILLEGETAQGKARKQASKASMQELASERQTGMNHDKVF